MIFISWIQYTGSGNFYFLFRIKLLHHKILQIVCVKFVLQAQFSIVVTRFGRIFSAEKL